MRVIRSKSQRLYKFLSFHNIILKLFSSCVVFPRNSCSSLKRSKFSKWLFKVCNNSKEKVNFRLSFSVGRKEFLYKTEYFLSLGAQVDICTFYQTAAFFSVHNKVFEGAILKYSLYRFLFCEFLCIFCYEKSFNVNKILLPP